METPTEQPKKRAPKFTRYPLINLKGCKTMALKLSQETRAGKFTRVSTVFLLELNALVEARIRERVRTTPSVGKTL